MVLQSNVYLSVTDVFVTMGKDSGKERYLRWSRCRSTAFAKETAHLDWIKIVFMGNGF